LFIIPIVGGAGAMVKDVAICGVSVVGDDIGAGINGALVTKTGAFLLGEGVEKVGLFEAIIGTAVGDFVPSPLGDGLRAGVAKFGVGGNAGLIVGAAVSGAVVKSTGETGGKTVPGIGAMVLGAGVVPVGTAGTTVGKTGFGAGEAVAALHVDGGSLDKSQMPALIQFS
jgi:hypothetical protein